MPVLTLSNQPPQPGVVLLTQPGVRNPDGSGVRFLVGFPEANSGSVAYFNSTTGPSTDLNVTLDNGTLATVEVPGRGAGLTGVLTFNRDATLYRAIVGSIRTVRDYVEGPRIIRPIFAHTTTQEGDAVVLRREYLNNTGGNTLSFAPADGTTVVKATPDGNLTITLGLGASEGKVRFTATVDWPVHLQAIQPADLLLAPSQRHTEIAKTPQVAQVSFLMYPPQKLLAGSWRFLTYFGRHLVAMSRLMMSRLASAAIEAGLAAALGESIYFWNMGGDYYQQNGRDFIPVGTVCHEETLGDYASYTNLQEGHPELGGRLYCDYKMIDADYLLLPSVAQYFLNTSSGAGREGAFLAGSVPAARGTALNANRTYDELLHANAELVLTLARPFAADPTIDNLIHLRPGLTVGNWRDSDTGLANAVIPFDVNTALLPGALRAIQDLAAAGILDPAMEAEADDLAAAWEAHALPFFEITVPVAEAQRLVASYSQALGVPAPAPVLLDQAAAVSGGNVTFFAVPIMHSDLGFNLLYQREAPEAIIRAIPALLADFPAGLLTPAGMVVANPAYSPLQPELTDLFTNFTNGFYHGSVIWGFQQALMVEGLERQLALCDTAAAPAWCSDTELVSALRSALDRLWSTISKNADVAFSEASC
ncbi:hypothetical protein ABPG77_005341 [Micractinium sp. CCAP 211/92]